MKTKNNNNMFVLYVLGDQKTKRYDRKRISIY